MLNLLAQESVQPMQSVPNYLIMLLVLVAVVLGASAVASSRNRSLGTSLVQGLGSLLWASPVIAVLAFVGMRVLPHFQFGSTTARVSDASPGWLEKLGGENEVTKVSSFEKQPESVTMDFESELPAWTNTPVQRLETSEGNSATEAYRVVVEGGWESSPEKARANVLEQTAKLVQDDFTRFYPGGSAIPENVIGDKAVRAEVLQEQEHDLVGSPFTMYRAYWQVEVSPEVRKQLAGHWKEEIGVKRAWLLGGVFGLLSLIAGTFAAYFHLDNRSNGKHRFRLKLAATAMMTAVALGALATLSQHV